MKLQQRQTWHDYTRWPLANEFASVQLELYPSEQDWGGTAFRSPLYWFRIRSFCVRSPYG